MQAKIRAVTQPFIDKVKRLKQYREKINTLQTQLDELKAVDPLNLTLQKYTERQQVQSFIDYLQTQNVEIGAIPLEKGSLFEQIGDIISAEVAKDETLISTAEHFYRAGVTNNQAVITETEANYLEVFNQVNQQVYKAVEPLVNDYLQALEYAKGKSYHKHLEAYLPQPLTVEYIKKWHEHETEKLKYGYSKTEKVTPIIKQRY